jgi:hypothetical protein
MTNSTTSEGWMQKSSFKEDINHVQATVRIEMARSHPSRYMHHQIREYSQWFLEIHNKVTDTLSRDMDRTDNKLNHKLTHILPMSLCRFHLPLIFYLFLMRFFLW